MIQRAVFLRTHDFAFPRRAGLSEGRKAKGDRHTRDENQHVSPVAVGLSG